MLKRTALFESHQKLGAKLVDFGGWEMPLHYGSQLDEHHSVRSGAGMFDVSHMLAIDVRGVDARAFLLTLLANNVSRLALPGKALYSCMLDESGGIIDDLIVYFLDETLYRLVVNAGTADKDLQWIVGEIARRALRVEAVARRDLALIAIQGPDARERFWRARPDAKQASEKIQPFQAVTVGQWLVARTGYTGEDGFEVMLPASEARELWDGLLANAVVPAGLGARDTLRLEAGMNLYGQDMDESVTPMESGLAWTVDLSGNRAFIGREALGRRQATLKLAGLVLRDKGVLRAHQKVRTRGGDGEITSGTFSPTLGLSIAFARIPIEVGVPEDVEVEIRGRYLRATTVKYPFVRHGKSMIDEQL